MNRWYSVYRNEELLHYSHGKYMTIYHRAVMNAHHDDLITVIPSDGPEKTFNQLLAEGYDIDIRIHVKKKD